MLYQAWNENPDWAQYDPKLRQLSGIKLVLSHTHDLVQKIPLEPAGIIMVRGPRQAGKSTFLRQFIQNALDKGIPPLNIALIEAESLDNRHDLLAEIRRFRESHEGFDLLLIDEVTSIEKWWLALKLFADEGLISESLVLCTGSSAVDLSEGADLLPGRRGKRYPVDFDLLPVRYADVNSHLSIEDYLLTGGFPWSINEFLCSGVIPPFVYELYRSWIEGSLIKKNHSIQNLPPMLRYITNRLGTNFSVTNLARDCGFGSNHTAESFISILNLNYILLSSFWSEPGNGVAAPRKNRKFYPADPFLYHLFFESGKALDMAFINSEQRINDPSRIGPIIESLVASQLRHSQTMYPLRYFIGKKEIDFVGNEAIEVKYRNHVSLDEFRWVTKVLPGGMKFTVITKDTFSSDGLLRAIPLKEWLLETV